jgi:hypothetical protein
LLEGISYRVPQHSGGFLSRAYSNLLYISWRTKREEHEGAKHKRNDKGIEMVITLILSVHVVCMYWNVALYLINMYSYLYVNKIRRKPTLESYGKGQMLRDFCWYALEVIGLKVSLSIDVNSPFWKAL